METPKSGDDLQFSTAEFADDASTAAATTTQAQMCLGCRQPIASTYYALRDKVLCPNCCAEVQAPPKGSRFGRLFKATMFGLGAGLLGALIWFAIRRATNYEIGLVAVLVGFMVGKAVRKGSGGRGGRGYQVLAVVLTYCCIAANYMPDIVEAVVTQAREHRSAAADGATSTTEDKSVSPSTPAASGDASTPSRADSTPGKREPLGPAKLVGAIFLLGAIIFGLSLAAPFLGGAQNLIGLLIIGFALWEAWKFNRRVSLPITGPYQVGDTAPAAGVPA